MPNKSAEASAPIAVEAESVSLLLDVLHDNHVEPKVACDWMQIDRAKFTRFKTGEASPTLKEIDRLPLHIFAEWRRRVDEARGLSGGGDERVFAQLVGQLMTALLNHRLARRRSEVA